MNTFIVIAVLTVLNCIDIANGNCTAATGDECGKTYTDANKTTDEQKCTTGYTYGKCLYDAMCNSGDYLTNYNTSVGTTKCGDCTLTAGLACLNSNCSQVAAVKSCLDNNKCNTGDFKTIYDALETRCNGCGTVTVSVLMMFLSTLLIFNKNY